MAPSPLQQRRTHNILLFQKLLNLRDGASPFSLVLDTLEQSGAPIIREFVRRGKIGKSKIIAVSFCSLRKKLYFEPDVFISARAKSLASLRSEIVSYLSAPSTISAGIQKYMIIIDALNPLASRQAGHLPTFLSSLLLGSNISLLGSYHVDIPLPAQSPYQADPLTTLTYLATAIITAQSVFHVIARKKARDKSLQPPEFGLAEHREGVLIGMSNTKEADGVVVEMEIRRKSGHGVSESFILTPPSPDSRGKIEVGNIILLDDHPAYSFTMEGVAGAFGQDEEVETTFSLGLSEKQRRDRDGVVLPYFDAQKEGGASGPGEGGRILYEMGAEDREDFDDEEDEI